MPTGPRHHRLWIEEGEGEDGERKEIVREAYCRCTIGSDHNDSGDDQFDYDDDDDGESLDVSDAADIWLSHGMDEDYTFGYDEDALRRAADLD